MLNELKILDDEWIVQLRDAVAVHRDAKGALKMDQSYQPTGWQGAGWGGALGLIIGATLAIPFTAGASAAVAAGAVAAAAAGGAALGATSGALDASFWKDEYGIPEDFVNDVSTLVTPGSSAIYAIIESSDEEAVAATFERFGRNSRSNQPVDRSESKDRESSVSRRHVSGDSVSTLHSPSTLRKGELP